MDISRIEINSRVLRVKPGKSLEDGERGRVIRKSDEYVFVLFDHEVEIFPEGVAVPQAVRPEEIYLEKE